MATKKGVKKLPKLSLNELQRVLNPNKEHPKEYYNFPLPLQQSIGIKGLSKTGIMNVYGRSNTGKTTLFIHLMKEAIEQGALPVLILTENKFSWEYARKMGIPVEVIEHVDESTGNVTVEYRGDFLVANQFKSIEKTFETMEKVMAWQKDGTIRQDVLFLYDSVGSLGTEYAQGGGKKMAELATYIGSVFRTDVASKINSTKIVWNEDDNNYQAAAMIISHASISMPKMGMPQMTPRSSNAIFYASELALQFGGVMTKGTKDLTFEKKNSEGVTEKIKYGITTKLSVTKNHSSGVDIMNKEINVTPHGFIKATSEAVKQYKKEKKQFLADTIDFDKQFSDESDTDDTIGISYIKEDE